VRGPTSVRPSVVRATLAGVTEPGYTEDGVPTFDHVRETIERRSTTAAGYEELVAESPEGQDRAEREAKHDSDARDKLEEIRRSLRGEG
jgi:phage shock protein A